jgi:hypothetical protein
MRRFWSAATAALVEQERRPMPPWTLDGISIEGPDGTIVTLSQSAWSRDVDAWICEVTVWRSVRGGNRFIRTQLRLEDSDAQHTRRDQEQVRARNLIALSVRSNPDVAQLAPIRIV